MRALRNWPPRSKQKFFFCQPLPAWAKATPTSSREVQLFQFLRYGLYHFLNGKLPITILISPPVHISMGGGFRDQEKKNCLQRAVKVIDNLYVCKVQNRSSSTVFLKSVYTVPYLVWSFNTGGKIDHRVGVDHRDPWITSELSVLFEKK